MSNNNEKQVTSPRFGLLDMLDPKSLEAMKKFGHVYRDKYSGRTRIRVFKNKNI